MRYSEDAGITARIKAIRIAGTKYDRRCKVLPEQRDEMIQMYESGTPVKEIAALFKVTNMRVYQIVRGYKLPVNNYRYSSEYRAIANRKLWEYKRSLFERGLIPI